MNLRLAANWTSLTHLRLNCLTHLTPTMPHEGPLETSSKNIHISFDKMIGPPQYLPLLIQGKAIPVD